MTETISIKSKHKIVSIDPAPSDEFAVFIAGGKAWEERVTSWVTCRQWGEIRHDGIRYRSKERITYSSMSDGRTPNELRAGFVGVRPREMEREEFIKAARLSGLAAATYKRDVTATWSLSLEEP